jgi:DNA-binding NtrC family response regulator
MVIDDEENILKALSRVLRNQDGWEFETYVNPHDALKRATTSNFDLFLSDFRMPEMDGVKLLTQIRYLQPESMRLILSGYTDLDALIGAINQAEIYRFIVKPWQDLELTETIKQALCFRDIQVENRFLADQLRAQQVELDKRKDLLEKYRDRHPELFSVEWADDGSIILEDHND